MDTVRNMRKKRYVVNGKGDISPEAMDVINAIVRKARKEKDEKTILDVIRDSQISKVVRQKIAIMYLKELKEITKEVFYKNTIRKLSKAIRRIEITLIEQGFNECAKAIRQNWNKWIQNDLWAYLKEKGKIGQKTDNRKTEEIDELDVLKKYL